MSRIIIVERNIEQQKQLCSLLSDAGHEVRGVVDGRQLSECEVQFVPDIVLLDCSLHTNKESAVSLAVELHARYGTAIGIIMVAAQNNMQERLACRRAGADHYLVKPLVMSELLAIIRNLARRLHPVPRRSYWQLRLTESTLVVPGHPPIPLTAWEAAVLLAMASMPGQQIAREKLIEAVGKNPLIYDHRALEAGLSRLRKKLPSSTDATPTLQALRGFGYRFNRPLSIR
jgi:DNA-binding response OmpR family regulator